MTSKQDDRYTYRWPPMKRVIARLPEEFYEELQELSRRRGVSMAALIRRAVDQTYMDDLDNIAGEFLATRWLDEPGEPISWEEARKQLDAIQLARKQHKKLPRFD